MKKLFILLLLATTFVLAQAPTYECRLKNGVQVSDRIYEFDIYLLSTGVTPLELANIQMGITYNTAIKTGTFTISLVAGSSQLNSNQIPSSFNGTTAGAIKIAPKANPGAGSGTIISSTAPGTRVARIRITSSTAFGVAAPNFGWSFSTTPYNTIVSAYYDAGAGVVAANVTNQASHFTSDLVNNVLPVELSSFSTISKGRDVVVEWKTATEVNSSSFEVERAAVKENSTAREWSKVSSIKANGNSNSPIEYTYIDKKLNSGKYAYRLKMIDMDGSFTYSKIESSASIALPDEFSLSQNYPNPFNPTTKIDYQLPEDAHVTLDLYAISGEKISTLVNAEQTAGYYTVSVSTSQFSNLSTGMYIYRITSSAKNASGKFTSVKKMLYLK